MTSRSQRQSLVKRGIGSTEYSGLRAKIIDKLAEQGETSTPSSLNEELVASIALNS